MKLPFPAAVLFLFVTAALSAQSTGMFGDWLTPNGSVIHVEHCGDRVCLQAAAPPPNVPTNDIHNPDPALRGRAVCGMVIGKGFALNDADHASGGTLYDPRTGKTYHGGMTLEGTKLHLRGYVGIPLFGASQTWTRFTQPVKPCSEK